MIPPHATHGCYLTRRESTCASESAFLRTSGLRGGGSSRQHCLVPWATVMAGADHATTLPPVAGGGVSRVIPCCWALPSRSHRSWFAGKKGAELLGGWATGQLQWEAAPAPGRSEPWGQGPCGSCPAALERPSRGGCPRSPAIQPLCPQHRRTVLSKRRGVLSRHQSHCLRLQDRDRSPLASSELFCGSNGRLR